MSAKKSVILFTTLDVEPTEETAGEKNAGPPNWEYSMKSILAYIAILATYNLSLTLFVSVEALEANPEEFRQWEKQGIIIGLHLHPWKFGAYYHNRKKYMTETGGLNREGLVAILTENIEIFTRVMGHPPKWFRSGAMSGNDYLFGVLAELGFVATSCSLPGRVAPGSCAVWAGAPIDIHYADDAFRMNPGNLDLVEIPVAVDTTITAKPYRGVTMHADPRPDIDWTQHGTNYEAIYSNIFDGFLERGTKLPVVNPLTHNEFAYWDPEDPTTLQLHESIAAVYKVAAAKGFEVVSGTIEDIDREFRKLPREEPPRVGGSISL